MKILSALAMTVALVLSGCATVPPAKVTIGVATVDQGAAIPARKIGCPITHYTVDPEDPCY